MKIMALSAARKEDKVCNDLNSSKIRSSDELALASCEYQLENRSHASSVIENISNNYKMKDTDWDEE